MAEPLSDGEPVIYSGPQWYYEWLQSADNSTDGDTRHDLPWIREVDNAAAALCLDYIRRRGKGSCIRDELHWNYLFSNKNCARVWSVLSGIAFALLVVLCVALYQSVRSVMCLVTYASLGASDVILGATIKTVCFIWTPFTTTVSVGCQHALIFVSFYRDFLRKLLDLASPIVRDHYSSRVPKSYRQAMSSPQAEQWREAINKELSGLDACEPCDGYSPMPWKIRVYRNLHLAFSLHDDAVAALYARLLHLYIWATVRCHPRL